MKYCSFKILLLGLLFLALLHGAWVLWRLDHQKWPVQKLDVPTWVEGVVVSMPQNKLGREGFWLETQGGILQLNWYPPAPHLMPGNHLQLWVKLKDSGFQGNPGEFDYASYLKRQGVVAEGYVLNRLPFSLAEEDWGGGEILEYFRSLVYNKVIVATAGLPMQGILLALILGDKTLLNSVQMEVFERTGTSYFMVISGLHIVLFALIGSLLARYVWSLSQRATLWIPAQRLALVVGLGLGLLYSILAGFVVPTQRALWMIGLMGLSQLFLKTFTSMQMLFWAFVLVLLWNPFSIYSVAFWLSFMAVFFLIYTMRGRSNHFWMKWIYPQWVMYWALSPILIYCFQNFSVIGFLTNLIAVPFMILAVIPLALLGAVFLFILPSVGIFLFWLSNTMMSWLWQILVFFGESPYWGMTLKQPSFAQMLLGILGLLLFFSRKKWLIKLLGLLMLIPLFVSFPSVKEGNLKETTLHLETGSATVYQTRHHILVEETVPQMKTGKLAISHIIVPYLQHEGIDHVDLWVLHFDGKLHSFEALQNAWIPISVDRVVTDQDSAIFDSHRFGCDAPLTESWDGVRFVIGRREAGECEILTGRKNAL